MHKTENKKIIMKALYIKKCIFKIFKSLSILQIGLKFFLKFLKIIIFKSLKYFERSIKTGNF